MGTSGVLLSLGWFDMATINIPGASEVSFPPVGGLTPIGGADVETLDTPDTPATVSVSVNSVLPFPDYSGGGGGPTRPSTGQIYPRGL